MEKYLYYKREFDNVSRKVELTESQKKLSEFFMKARENGYIPLYLSYRRN